MGRATREEADKNETKKLALETAGEVFPDGAAIELVANPSAGVNQLALLLWDREKVRVAPKIEHRGQAYRPIPLHETIRRAVRLPSDAVGDGSMSPLLTELAGLIEQYIFLPKPESFTAAVWCLSTWLADLLSSPPCLLLSGPDMDLAVKLFRLMHSLCRRPLLLADISPSRVRTLPTRLRPTLLVNQPVLSPGIRALWRSSNYKGFVVPGNGGVLLDIVGSKAVFTALENPTDDWADSVIHLALPQGRREPLLSDTELVQIANRLQPRLLMFRLRNFVDVNKSGPIPSRLNLPAFIQENSHFVETVIPLLQRQEQDAVLCRGCDVKVALVEVLWDVSHTEVEIAVSKLTALTNCLLRCRGETIAYRAEEIGWRLKALGLYRHRDGDGMQLRFSREHRLRIHQAVQQFGLVLPPKDGCPDCTSPDAVAR